MGRLTTGYFKKSVSLLLAAGILLGLAGCGNKEDSAAATKYAEKNVGTKQAVTIEGDYYKGEYSTIEDDGVMSNIIKTEKALYFVSYNMSNSERKLGRYDLASKETSEVPLADDILVGMDSIAADKEGNLLFIVADWEASNGAGAVPYKICKINDSGEVLFEKDVTDLLEGLGTPYLYQLVVGEDDSIIISNGAEKIWFLDKEGNLEFELPVESWVSSMGLLPDGNLAAFQYGAEGMEMKVTDKDKKAWGETYKCDRFANTSGMVEVSVVPSKDGKLYFLNAAELFTYDMQTGESEVVANWLANDVLSDDIRYMEVDEAGEIIMVTADSTGNVSGAELVKMTKAEAKEMQEKQVLTLGTIQVQMGLRRGVIEFNKRNDKYRVEIIEYGKDDYEAGVTKFKNEIIAGNMPDIVNISDGSEDFYAAKGLLEDLKPFLDGENGINRADYFENILTAFESDGKLYKIGPDFVVNTLVGKTSVVGDKKSWSMDDIIALANEKDEGVSLFGPETETKSRVLEMCLYNNMEQYYNMSEGKCDFDNEEFRKTLEFSNLFPKETTMGEERPSDALLISEGRVLLGTVGMMSIRDYQMYHNMFGDDISFVGYPSQFDCGSIAENYDLALGMNAKSENKDGIWEFIRFFLEEDYQTKYTAGYPLLKAAFDKKAEEEMKKYYETNENGEEVEVALVSVGWQDYVMELMAATQEEVDAVKELISSVSHGKKTDEQVMSIILEEVQPYFDGQKSVEDVVSVIQNRANIYMNENR